jgi:hypothetical protein
MILKFKLPSISLKNMLDYRLLLFLSLFIGLAPFFPQPHIVEKLRMLMAGTLEKPVDIFDLFWHSWPFFLLAYRIARDIRR